MSEHLSGEKPAVKLGCCLNLAAAPPAKKGAELLELYAGLGYDYAELSLAWIAGLSDGEFAALTREIRSGGLPVEACNVFFPASLRLTGPEADLEAALEYAKRACSRAAEIGASIIVLGSAGAKNIPQGFPYPEAEKQLLTLLEALEDIVAPLDVTVTLEPLNTKESNFITSVSEGLALVRKAGLPHIQLLADYYHMRMEDEGYAAIREAGSSLRHTHIAAKEGRRFPRPGDGEDYAAFISSLRDISYSARLSVEGSSEDLEHDGEEAIKTLKSLIK